MNGLAGLMPNLHMVRRVITRAPDMGGEDYDAVSVERFHEMAANDDFAVHWGAHGLFYGIPKMVLAQVNGGAVCLANFSRKALSAGAATFPGFQVLNITARPDTLATRLATRGRETGAEIERRLAEADKPLPAGLNVVNLSNDESLDRTIRRAAALLGQTSV